MRRFKVAMSNGNTILVEAVTLVSAVRKAEEMMQSFGYYAKAMEIEYC